MARPLDDDEKALWGKVIASVQPMHPVKQVAVRISLPPSSFRAGAGGGASPETKPLRKGPTPTPPLKGRGLTAAHNLDGRWDRRISKGAVVPDVSVDLHGTGLSGAYNRLDGALEQAISQKMRVILLVTGKVRSHDRHSGEGRGAIASVVRDWLAASRHASSIAAVRNAHPRHGGNGALYIILKR